MNILITAGPTLEALDPVRFLSNHSSGKMGYALASEASRYHKVILISGPVAINPPKNAQLISVTSAVQMYKQVMKNLKNADVIIMVAAVADYRPDRAMKKKMTKKKGMTLRLIQNPDILKKVGNTKNKKQILVGFAAQTHRAEYYAKTKLKNKKCDWIVMNNVAHKGIGFKSDDNEVTLFSKDGKSFFIKKSSKKKIAKEILKKILVS